VFLVIILVHWSYNFSVSIPLQNHTLNRNEFLHLLMKQEAESSILEIGPLNRPLVKTQFTKYFDLLPTQELKAKALSEGLDPNTVPEIDFHEPNGNLAAVNFEFDNVVSSHCIEHQPDLIRHLIQCSRLLKKQDSKYWLVVPDKRYCFDALIPESSLMEIIRAHEEQATRPSIWKVIEHRALTTHNDPTLHWNNNNGIQNQDIKVRFNAAKAEFYASPNQYIDVHCWQFTPKSFSNIINALFELELIDFQVEKVWETQENDLEFFVILKKISRN
jgi:hypothetical protein